MRFSALQTKEQLLGHPVAGQSWESFVIEMRVEAISRARVVFPACRGPSNATAGLLSI